MLEETRRQQWMKFILAIILPTVMAVVISIASIYLVIIPAFKNSFMENKRELIRELTTVAWGIMELYEKEEQAGRLSRQEAQSKAIEEIEHLRYGEQSRDYFWISDMQPKLIMHPYSKELIGTDLSEYRDAEGKRVFMEIKDAVADSNSGFIDYIWSKKYSDKQDAPKLSYVKKFEPWGWVVGTGVFMDDVEAKTDQITRRLQLWIYVAVLLFSLLLFYVTHRSLIIERRRRQAEESLDLSSKKYKALVETAADPIMMVHNSTCIYANKSLEQLTGYDSAELEAMVMTDLFSQDSEVGANGAKLFNDALHGYIVPGKHEAQLRRKNGDIISVLMAMSRKDLGTQKVIVVTVQDLSSTKQIEEQLDESREKYRLLTHRLHIGVFRTTAEDRFQFLEANPSAYELLGVTDEQELQTLSLQDMLDRDGQADSLRNTLEKEGIIKEKVFRLRRRSGELRTVSISMIMTSDRNKKPLYCDGIIDDISRQQKTAIERENLIVELQTSMMFLNQPVGDVFSGYISCQLNTPIHEVARTMTEAAKTSILVSDENGTMIGIVTDALLRELVLVEKHDPQMPVYQVMSSPLIHIEDSALIFEAVLLMQERGVKHLVVRDSNSDVVSVISNEELLDVHRYSAAFLIQEIREAESVEDMVRSHKRLPRIIKALIDSGAHAKNITRIVTTITDTVTARLIEFAIEELGEPPVRFAFISLGSEGRGEQTLVTDQDNAIIFEDVEENQLDAAQDYFQKFSEMVCTWLDQVGYDFCKGEVMAMNPKWCQPVSVWEKYFSEWITESSPEDLMEVSIFFDFRTIYGDSRFTDELREHIGSRAENKAPFLYQMAQNTLLFKVPIDFFGNISFESGGDHPNTFNIKHVLAQITSFARIYAVNYGIESTNTLQRIDYLLENNVLNKASYEEVVESYNYLMQLRFRHQVLMISRGDTPDNHVHEDEISHMEKEMLEKIFGQVNNLRKRLSLVGHNEIYF